MARENLNVSQERDNGLRSGERQVANNLEQIEASHRWRYVEALKYINDTDSVLDLGCGCGYGTHILSQRARYVEGCDISPEAINYANENWMNENIVFRCISACGINKILESTGGVVCFSNVLVAFEIIEHLPDENDFYDLIKRSCPDRIILSTPYITTPFGMNKFHHHHYGLDEIVGTLFDDGYKIVRAELLYLKGALNIFYVGEKICTKQP